ncbi:hypothetical protein SCB71_17315 [Herbiconiux sp. KACC 21604]|uniref:hypothetical protein n=1 Tax=unclassified Herbiconiux TaxID=2618217 RepID=UPI001492A31B|nr:hypothetical protein [Herbiconiux sp. SALV-R1]QJU52196.1 hypothetical protein HL652_15270 [Herbiconiux sp. SALV-R1]WPO85960.1 hypothetical protein SCB71_17315 [Herbiconiux sp. KACC 21604]
MTQPTHDQLEASQHTEKRTVGGELRYYLKDAAAHVKKLNEPFDPDGLEAWFTPDGTFHAQGLNANAGLSATLGAAAGAAIAAG